MEGYPYFEPAGGLEYLFGVTTVDTGTPASAPGRLPRASRKARVEQFIDFVRKRLDMWPDLHVYHYASYEPSALKRLMSEHATEKTRSTTCCDGRCSSTCIRSSASLFVSRTTAIRSRRCEPSSCPRQEVARSLTVGDSILEFERWLESHDPSILEAITTYNEEDCLSTVRLRDWLLGRREEAERRFGVDIPWRVVDPR
jgi:uncharacterized protein